MCVCVLCVNTQIYPYRSRRVHIHPHTCMCLPHNIFLQNNFSYLHPNALYQAFALRAMDIRREYSFIICNALIPTISLAYISFLKKRKKTDNSYFALNHSSLGGNRRMRNSTQQRSELWISSSE